MQGDAEGQGLVGMAARTAVVAGTATAVSGRVARRQQRSTLDRMRRTSSRWRARGCAADAAPRSPTTWTSSTQLAQLRDQGILTPEEFEAKKKQILGL